MADDEAKTQQIERARAALKRGDFATGLAAAEAILTSDPQDATALYLAVVSTRFMRRFDAAEDYVRRLLEVSPEYGRGWQERGHLARDRGDRAGALAAYAQAVRINPSLIASWQARAQMASGPAAEHAARQAERIARLPPELVAVMNHYHEGRTLVAEEICRHYLQRNPRDVDGMRLLALIGMRLGVTDDAEFLLESAVEFEPDDIQLRLDYIDVLRQRQKFVQAREQAEALHAREPDNVLFQSRLAIESLQTGDYERAMALFDAVLEKLPGDPATLTSRGHALKTYGAQEDAVASYRGAIASRPDHGDAWYALANLKTYRFDEAEIAAMREQASRPDLALMDRVHLSFALGKALEDAHDYEASFGFYQEGNSLKRAQTRYDADAMSEELARQREVFTPELFEKHAGAGHPAPDPIFVVGLPRAGSTLLEQILASHTRVDGTLELPNILALAHRLRGRKAGEARYPQILHDLSPEQLAKFGQEYIENTSIHRQDAPFFIDKMPNNFRHIGLIHLILPNAKIIDARRDPMDCCFSGFKQLFAEGQEFTYGLTEVGRYYADYVALMDHWDEVLPGKVLRVQHEDVLDDLEGEVRRMLDHCGLEFEQACVDFYKTDRAVRTASSEQVRQPINRAGQGAWKPFEPWLGDLRAALGPLDPTA